MRRLLSMDELKTVGVSFSRPHLFRLIKSGDFPKPAKIGKNRNAWSSEEIDKWIDDRLKERYQVKGAA